MKVLVIFLLGLVALQQVVALEPEDPEVRGIKNEIIKIVQAIMNLIKNTMAKILGEIAKGINKIMDLLNSGINLVEDGIQAILDLINDLEKKALDLGLDITMCIFDQRELVKQLGIDTIANLRNTANRIINGINEIGTKTENTINGYIAIVDQILEDLKHCSLINPICMTKLLARATAASIKVTAELPLLALNVIQVVGENVIGGTADMLKITADFTTTTARITWEITTCVADIMPLK